MCLRWYSLRKALWRQQRWLNYRITDSSLECPSLQPLSDTPVPATWWSGLLHGHGQWGWLLASICFITRCHDLESPSTYGACTHLPVTFTHLPFSQQLGMNVDSTNIWNNDLLGYFLWESLLCAWNELWDMLALAQTGAVFLGCIIGCHSEMF